MFFFSQMHLLPTNVYYFSLSNLQFYIDILYPTQNHHIKFFPENHILVNKISQSKKKKKCNKKKYTN